MQSEVLRVDVNVDIRKNRIQHLGVTLMSRDINNYQFYLRVLQDNELLVMDDSYEVEVLSIFQTSKTRLLTKGTIKTHYVDWKFDPSYISKSEVVKNYVYVRKNGELLVSADANCFIFDVGLSAIDKDVGRVAEIYDENYQKHLDGFIENVNFDEIAQSERDREAAEILRQESYDAKVNAAIVEADVIGKVDSKVSELTPQINDLTTQVEQTDDEITQARGGKDTLGERLDETTAQLAQNVTRTSDSFITIDEMGGVGDYFLPDGTVNPAPTDNSDIIENIYAQGYKNIRFNKGSYFFSRPINMPNSGHIDLNGRTLYFAGDGINLGSHVWNKARVYNGSIFGISVDGERVGRGLYTDDGYIVYGQFDLTIRFFKEGAKFIAQDVNAQFAWSELDLTIEDCDMGLYFESGWANTVLFKQLILNRTTNEALMFNNVIQMHEFKIQKLVVEQCAKNSDSNKSPIHFKGCANGEITIDSGYFEGNGFARGAQANEVENFKLNGTKISEASQSWLLGDYVYSEDTNQITKQDLGYHSNFFYENCSFTLITRINNVYFATNLYGIASFYNSPNLPFYMDGIRLVSKGYSFPTIRHLFKSNLTNNRVHGRALSLDGGNPNNINYGEVKFFGDKFSTFGVTETNQHLILTRAQQTIIPTNETIDVYFTSTIEGGPTFTRLSANGDIIVQEDGIYTLMFRFVSLGTRPDSMITVTFRGTQGSNSASVVIPQILTGVKNTAYAMMKFKKGDNIKVQMNHTDSVDLTIQGINNNTFDFMIIKNVDL